MISDKLGKILHDKSTLGIQLSTEEMKQLQEWYDYHDEMEDKLINKSIKQISLADLKKQVELSLEKLSILTSQVRDISKENEAIKLEKIYEKPACQGTTGRLRVSQIKTTSLLLILLKISNC